MDFAIDLRFLFPPLLNLIIFLLFLKSQDANSWPLQDGTDQILLYPILKLEFWYLILAIVLLLLFLLTPIRLPVNASLPISVNCGARVSVLLAVSIIGSVFLAPSLFLVSYLCLIMLSLCYAAIASLLKRCFNWFRHLAVTSPIISINRNQEDGRIDIV